MHTLQDLYLNITASKLSGCECRDQSLCQ